jgi:hypothetical protein
LNNQLVADVSNHSLESNHHLFVAIVSAVS